MDPIAVYGAILATATALWTICRDVLSARRKVLLFLGLNGSVSIGRAVVDVSFILRVTNKSATRHVEILSLQLGDQLVWATCAQAGGVRPATLDEPLLPIRLSPSQSVHIPLYLTASNFERFLQTTDIRVADSFGRTYRLGKRQLRSAQTLVRRLVAEAAERAAADEVPFVIRSGRYD